MSNDERNWLILLILSFIVVMTVVLSMAYGGMFAYHGAVK